MLLRLMFQFIRAEFGCLAHSPSSHGARVGIDGRSDLDGVFVSGCLDGGGDFCNSGSVAFCHHILLALNDLVGAPSGGSVCFLCDTFGDFVFYCICACITHATSCSFCAAALCSRCDLYNCHGCSGYNGFFFDCLCASGGGLPRRV